MLVGTLVDVNVFHISAADLLAINEIVLKLPAFEAAVNASVMGGQPPPTTSVIINVMYDDDWTAHGTDPSGTTDSDRTRATSVKFDTMAFNGLFASPVRSPWCCTASAIDSACDQCVGACGVWFIQEGSPYYILPFVVWNFPYATDIYMANLGFTGTVLAPHAGMCPRDRPLCASPA